MNNNTFDQANMYAQAISNGASIKQLFHKFNWTNEAFTFGQDLFFSRSFNIKAYFALGLYT